jgi:hypothetical protein
MKKNYLKPTTIVVKLESEGQLLEGSLTSVSTNLGDGDDAIRYGGGSNQAARVKGNSVDWDDWE